MESLVVNFFAGPGAGKTTCAWELAAALKKLGLVVEYASEYTKELVWEERDDLLNGSRENQNMVFAEQKRRLDRLVGKVDVIVTDSPLLLQVCYVKEDADRFETDALTAHNSYHNFNLFISRGAEYEQQGRVQNRSEAETIDESVKDMLKRNGIICGEYSYNHTALETVTADILNTLKKTAQQVVPRENAKDSWRQASIYDRLGEVKNKTLDTAAQKHAAHVTPGRPANLKSKEIAI
jgi:adenylate kinase family enzyme